MVPPTSQRRVAAYGSPLSNLLRQRRAAAGLTQEELAELAGVSVRTVSDVERGLRSSIYRDTTERLASALGLEASERAEFEALAREGSRRGALTAGALPPGREGLSSVPFPTTPLIGREREVEVLAAALADHGIRLVTLTGPGGIGKTRLAIEAARGVERDDASCRVAFIPLGALAEPALVGSTVAVALGVTSPKSSAIDSISAHLGDDRVLLVLDTFEHLMDSATVVATLLARCEELTVLVTSRQALSLTGEHEVVVSPLDVGGADADDPLGSPAADLFVQRARAVRSDLDLDGDSARLVHDICVRLDGLPLAIELAATRVKHLTLDALWQELDDRLSVLSHGQRDLPRRQRTMRDTLAWSHDLLTPEEQALFRGLSVFAGGWMLDAAESVTSPVGGSLSLMSALVDKSLVFLLETRTGEGRYSMFDIVREFAGERAEASGEQEALRERHARWCLALAEEAEPELGAAGQSLWYRRLEEEHDNLRAALAWFTERSDAEGALRLAGALWLFWRRQGHFSEGRRWLRGALAIEPPAPGARAKALWGSGWLAFVQGDYDECEAMSAELLEVAAQHGGALDERNALTVRGMMLMAQSRAADALEPFERALEICLPLPPGWLRATSHLNLGMANLHAGKLDRAEELITAARSIYEEIGDRHFAARSDGYLGFVALRKGARDEAEASFGSSLRSFQALEDLQGIAEGLEGLAAVYASSDDRHSALRGARLAGAAVAIRERLTAKQYPFDKAGMALYLEAGRAVTGETEWRQAFETGRALSIEEAVELAGRA